MRDGGDDFTITPLSLHFDDIGTASRGEVGTSPSNHFKLAERIAGIFGKEVVWVTTKGNDSINGVVVPGGDHMVGAPTVQGSNHVFGVAINRVGYLAISYP